MSNVDDAIADHAPYIAREIARAVNTVWMAAMILRVFRDADRFAYAQVGASGRSAWNAFTRAAAELVGVRPQIEPEILTSYWNDEGLDVDEEFAVGFLMAVDSNTAGTERESPVDRVMLEQRAFSVIARGVALLFRWLTEGSYALMGPVFNESRARDICVCLRALVTLLEEISRDIPGQIKLLPIVRTTCAEGMRESREDPSLRAWWYAARTASLTVLAQK